MNGIIGRIYPGSGSSFLLIEKRLRLLKFLALIITMASGLMMIASVNLIDNNNSVGHYALVCQAAKIMPVNGVRRIEIIRTFPLDDWLGYGSGNNNLIIMMKAEVNNQEQYYAIAESYTGQDYCLGELVSEYSEDVLSKTIEYEGDIFIIGEIVKVSNKNPPIFLETICKIMKGEQEIEVKKVSTVYGKEVIISGLSNKAGSESLRIDQMCIVKKDAVDDLAIVNEAYCTNSQVRTINIGLNAVIINDNYFSKQ